MMIMNKTGNTSPYRELQDSELELVSGGEGEKLIAAAAMYNAFADFFTNFVTQIGYSLNNAAKNL